MDDAGAVVRRIADDLVAVDPAPGVAVVWGTLAVALVLVAWRPAWRRTRHVVTIAHEGGHAAAALLSGRRLQGIRLHADTSGVTVSRGRPTGPGMVATVLAGYPAPALVGLAAAGVLAAGRAAAALWVTVLLLAAMLLMIRNLYGLLVLVLVGTGVALLSWWADPAVRAAVAHLAAWVLLLGAPRAVLELWGERRRSSAAPGRGRTDADQLARLTRLPAGLWTAVLLLVVLAAGVLGGLALTAQVRA
ncbi:M50 family metallopeptidase [Nocardioides sp. YIM 152588]|uniref:M50 family metallopeptidase n=1 Tax=Nocardioides sp. YIM 152588 TaxID=3158259 RepID=UPI0032E3B4E6